MPKTNVTWELNNYSTDVMTGGSNRRLFMCHFL